MKYVRQAQSVGEGCNVLTSVGERVERQRVRKATMCVKSGAFDQ